MKTHLIGLRGIIACASVALSCLSPQSSAPLYAAEAHPLKLAIYSSGEPGSSFADLLLTELTGLTNVTMLERAALNKIVQEQALATSSSAALVKAGSILGADGIVVLDARGLANKTWIALRVVGVRRGVALGWWEYTVRKEESASWPKGAALQIKQLLPKLTSAVANSSPLSVVGFSSPSSSRSATSLEREINSLLLQRLGAEPDLLVLERQKLLDAAFEKILSGDDRKFWNGAYLLEGTINPERIEADSVTMRARLTPPSVAPVEFTITGARTNLGDFSARFVGEVRRLLKAKPSVVTWNAEAEAKRFYEQAETAARWKFWPEAAAAADTSMALGKDDLDTRRLRLQAYTGLFEANPFLTHRVRARFGVIQGYFPPPSKADLAAALETAYQLRDLARTTNEFRDARTGPAASAAVQAIGWLTFRYYFGTELRNGNEAELAELRSSMRNIAKTILDAPEVANGYLPLLYKFGPVWEETPEDGLKLHQQLRSLPAFVTFQLTVPPYKPLPQDDLQMHDWTPPLCGWKWSDRRRTDAIWEAFPRPLIATGPEPRPQQAPPPTSLSSTQLLEALIQALSNNQVVSPEVLGKLELLRTRPEKEKALSLLQELDKQARTKRDFRTSLGLTRPMMELRFALRQAQEEIRSAAFSQLKAPPGLRSMPTSHTWHLHTDLRIGMPPDATVTAKFHALTNLNELGIGLLHWADDKLWVYCEGSFRTNWSNEAGGGERVFPIYFLACFDPVSERIERIEIPANFISLNESTRQKEFAVLPDQIALFFAQRVITYDRRDKKFSSGASPLESPHLLRSGDRLFLWNDETLLETADCRDFKVLASVHRRPAVSPLDSAVKLNLQMFASAEQRVFLLHSNALYAVQGTTIQEIRATRGVIFAIMPFADAALVHEAAGLPDRRRNRRILYYGREASEPVRWWSGQDFADAAWVWRWVHDRPFEPSRFPFLIEPPLNVELSTFMPFRGLPMVVKFPPNPGDAQLYFWRSNHWRPVTLTISGGAKPFDGAQTFVAGGEFFAVGKGGIWHLKGQELLSVVKQAIATDEQRLASEAREIASILAPYAQKKNGQLDPDEYSALAQEPQLYHLAWDELDANHNGSINGNEMKFFDFNHDGKLDTTEHQALLNAVSYFAGVTFPSLDTNRDGLLQQTELKGFCDSGTFQRYDSDGKDGLTLVQWTALTAELMDRRFCSSSEGLPALTPTNRQYFLEIAVPQRYLTPTPFTQRLSHEPPHNF